MAGVLESTDDHFRANPDPPDGFQTKKDAEKAPHPSAMHSDHQALFSFD